MARLRLEELLAERGHTLYWLAKESGLSHTSLFRLKHGQASQIRLEVIDRLCAALECSPADLIEIADAPYAGTPPKKGSGGKAGQGNRRVLRKKTRG